MKVHKSILTKFVFSLTLAEFLIMFIYSFTPLNTFIGRNRLLGIIIDTSLVAIVCIIVCLRILRKPLTKIKDAAIEMGKGKLDTRIAVKSEDEIGIVASAFNEMAENLKDSQEKIQAQNEELNANNEELKAAGEELESTNEELMQSKEELEAANEELRVANEEAVKAKEATEKKAEQLERFNKLAVGRELEMKKLKDRIKELETRIGTDKSTDRRG